MKSCHRKGHIELPNFKKRKEPKTVIPKNVRKTIPKQEVES